METTDKLLLVDGSNLLFQMFFGMPARIFNRAGKAVHGTVGFVGALLKIIRMTKPTHVAVLFDGEHENPRAELNADYKANRPDYGAVDESDCPFSQESDIYAAVDALGIKRAETTVCETDDWMAAYALGCGNDMRIVISSFDSDYFQLITDNVSVLRYRGAKTTVWTPESVRERFGITPDKYADYKSLVGDPSDNIKGADKIGPKTAASLLQHFSSLSGVIDNAEIIEKPSVRESIVRNSRRLLTNYKLIKLTGDAALPFALDELVFTYDNTTSTEVLNRIGILP